MPVIDIQWKGHRDGYARGLLVRATGDIYVWPEFERAHASMLEALGLRFADVSCFYISAREKGSRFGPPYRLEMYELSEDEARQVLRAVPNAEPPARRREEAA